MRLLLALIFVFNTFPAFASDLAGVPELGTTTSTDDFLVCWDNSAAVGSRQRQCSFTGNALDILTGQNTWITYQGVYFLSDCTTVNTGFCVDTDDNKLYLRNGGATLANLNMADMTITLDDSVALRTDVTAITFDVLAVADLSDTTSPHVLTTAETINKVISNYAATGADRVFTLPICHDAANVVFDIGDEFQIDVEPPAGTALILNGTAMATDEHIVNTADTLYERMVCTASNANGTCTYLCDSKYTNFAEATP